VGQERLSQKPTVVAALAERGISLAGVNPKPITTELLATADALTQATSPGGPG
jgi:protein-tyrosine-phosphatase